MLRPKDPEYTQTQHYQSSIEAKTCAFCLIISYFLVVYCSIELLYRLKENTF